MSFQNKLPTYPEEWKTIVTATDYEVSNHGRVRRPAYKKVYTDGRERNFPTRYCAFFITSAGKACFWTPHGQRLVSIVVANAFLPNPQRMSCVINVDGDVYNNAVTNLKWGRRCKGWAD